MRKEGRFADLGPGARRFDVKTLAVVIGLFANIGAIVWKGGEISAKFDALQGTVGEIRGQMQVSIKAQSETDAELRVHGERLVHHSRQLDNHEGRLSRIEEKLR